MKSVLILAFALAIGFGLSAGPAFAQSSDPAAQGKVQVPEPKEPSKELPPDIVPPPPPHKAKKPKKSPPAPVKVEKKNPPRPDPENGMAPPVMPSTPPTPPTTPGEN